MSIVFCLIVLRASHASVFQSACSVSDFLIAVQHMRVVVSVGAVFLLGATS